MALALSLDCCQGLVNANLRDITVDNNNEPHVDSTDHRITGGKNLDANNWTVTIGSEKDPFNKKCGTIFKYNYDVYGSIIECDILTLIKTDVHDNTVTIQNNATEVNNVYGGGSFSSTYFASGKAYNNTLNIQAGNIKGSAYGGYSGGKNNNSNFAVVKRSINS